MLGRLATYVVPASSVVVTALVLLGPGAPKQAPFARVRGVPMASGRTVSLRIEGGRRLFGVDDVAAFDDVTVEVLDQGKALPSWVGSIGPDGVAEASLAASDPIAGPLDVTVRTGRTVLASGSVPLRSPSPPVVSEGSIRGVSSGDFVFSVVASRGVVAAPFPDEIEIRVSLAPHVSPHQDGFVGIQLEASAPGAEIGTKIVQTNDKGEASVRLAPLSHTVELAIDARAPYGAKGRWEGLLPVHAGAIWVEPGGMSAGVRLTSPAPRDRAYVSLVGDLGRFFGAVVPLSRDGDGFYRGWVALPSIGSSKTAALVVSGDPFERGSGTAAFPIVPPRGAIAPARLELLLDGASASEARERGRAAKARHAAIFLVAAAALAEVVLIFVRTRMSQRALDENLAEAVSADASRDAGEAVPLADRARILATARERNPMLRVALAAALVLLGFAMIAALSTFSW